MNLALRKIPNQVMEILRHRDYLQGATANQIWEEIQLFDDPPKSRSHFQASLRNMTREDRILELPNPETNNRNNLFRLHEIPHTHDKKPA